MKHWLSAIAAITLMLVSAHTGRAQDAQQELTILAPGIMKGSFDMLLPGFEAKTGHKVKATYGAEDATKQQIIRGEAFDVPVLEVPYANVIASGNVVMGSETRIASIPVGFAVRKGAPKPDISTAAGLKTALLAANGISYPNPAPAAASGISVEDTLKKLGVLEQLQPKIKLAQGGARAMALVASGDVEVGMTFLPGMTNAGIDVVGILPSDVSTPTGVSAFVTTHAKDPKAAKELVEYLSSPEAEAVYKAQKMLSAH